MEMVKVKLRLSLVAIVLIVIPIIFLIFNIHFVSSSFTFILCASMSLCA